ncbi:MAG: S46 family peptidase [Acidobacteria bacterium]|nr:S46 family peptidase [Acidobacteriota bacterium]
MRHRVLISLFVSLMFLATPFRLWAEEGMWLPNTVENLSLSKMKKMGFALKPGDIYDPQAASLTDAIVIVDGGTGALVSFDGLLLTNHHVAFDALVSASTPQANYSETGFLAKTRAEELPAKNYTVSITKSFKDVTADVLSVIKEGMSDEERQKAIDAKSREMAEAAEKQGDGIEANVVEMLNGLNYYLFVYEVLKDVRIVYAPPKLIGYFGGDPDNFEWPRHTGDFTFMRAYIGPDGKPAEYSEKNVPYKPKKILPISLDGYKEGDFVMVMGYPGSTFRYRESYSIDYRQHHLYPYQIDILQRHIDLLEEAGKRDAGLAIRYASEIFGLSNALKNFQGSLQGLRRSNLLERRRAEEAAFMQYLDQHPDLKARYGNLLPQFAALYRELESYEMKQNILSGLLTSSDTLRLLSTAWGRALDREKPEAERSPAYPDKAIDRIKKNIPETWKERNRQLERAYIELYLAKADALPEGQRIESVDRLFAGKSGEERRKAEAEFAQQLVGNPRFNSAEDVVKLFDLTAAELKALNDPVLSFVASAKAELDPVDQRYQRFAAGVTRLRPLYIEGMSRWKKTSLYPDANRTLRFTYGQVKSYKPRDAVFYDYMTTLRGVIEKDTGREPFDVPERLKQLATARDFGPYIEPRSGDVPVAFISDTDITGGNSGSPIMNGRGEMIGIIFDGNYEGLGSDYVFNPALSRAIAVDIRYVLFVTEKVSGAKDLLKELQIQGRAAAGTASR